MDYKTIRQKFLQFEIDSEAFNEHVLHAFADKVNAKDLIALNPSVTNNNRYLVYCTRQNDMPFQLFNGPKTLAKKLRIKPESVHMVPAIRNCKYPDRVFNLLDPSVPMANQIHMALGQYANYKLIEAHMNTAMTQNNNRRVVKKVMEDGAMKAVADGTLSIGQLKSAQAYEAELKNAQAAEENRSKDLPAGTTWSFVCHKTGKEHFIESHMMEDESDQRQSIESEVEIERLENGSMRVTGIKEPLVKKKHYYFYSPAGYGKTHMLSRVFGRMCNVTTVNDPKNFIGARPDAQFIVIDEYAPEKRMSMADLKSLTSGNPAGSFAGNRKSYGASFVPRNDVQVVILSNHHLFYCMGKGPGRAISSVDAKALRERFHIIKMHEGVDNDYTEEEEAGDLYIEYTAMEREERRKKFDAWLNGTED